MLKLEGVDEPEKTCREGQKKQGRHMKSSINAMGKRVKTHKRHTRKALTCLPDSYVGRYDDCPLIPKNDWATYDLRHRGNQDMGSATPENNNSILDFYGVNRRKQVEAKRRAALGISSEDADQETGIL